MRSTSTTDLYYQGIHATNQRRAPVLPPVPTAIPLYSIVPPDVPVTNVALYEEMM